METTGIATRYSTGRRGPLAPVAARGAPVRLGSEPGGRSSDVQQAAQTALGDHVERHRSDERIRDPTRSRETLGVDDL